MFVSRRPSEWYVWSSAWSCVCVCPLFLFNLCFFTTSSTQAHLRRCGCRRSFGNVVSRCRFFFLSFCLGFARRTSSAPFAFLERTKCCTCLSTKSNGAKIGNERSHSRTDFSQLFAIYLCVCVSLCWQYAYHTAPQIIVMFPKITVNISNDKRQTTTSFSTKWAKYELKVPWCFENL